MSDLFHEIKIGILVHNTACDHAIVTNRRKDFIKIVDVEFLKDWINSKHGEKNDRNYLNEITITFDALNWILFIHESHRQCV